MEENKEFKQFRIGDTIYTTKTTRKFDNRKFWEYPDPTKVLSYIPGTVVSIEVTEGQKLSTGDVILSFEAMKMVTKVLMPYDGEIVKMNVKVGDRFPKEFVLAEIKK